MPAYPTPPWLNPSAAQGYGELAAGAQHIQLEREKLSQEAQQHAMDMQQQQQEMAQRAQAAQQQAAKDSLLDQQKLQVDKAYKDSELGLRQQNLDMASKQFQFQTNQAAQKFAATQQFQKAILPVEKGGEGLTPQAAALKYMAPSMTPDAVGRMSTTQAPFTLGAPTSPPGRPDLYYIQTSPHNFRQIPAPPETATNAPSAIPVPGEDGKPIGHWVIPPGGGKAHWQPKSTTKTSGLDEAIKAYQQQKSGGASAAPEVSADEVVKVTKDGRKAVFNSKTKQFVRWADAPKESDATE